MAQAEAGEKEVGGRNGEWGVSISFKIFIIWSEG